MRNVWILVADASRARLFTKSEQSRDIHMLTEFHHSESRLHTSQLVTDSSGRMDRRSSGNASPAMTPTSDPHEQEIQIFATKLGQHLETARQRGEFNYLVLIAPSHFLGLLRAQLSPDTRKLLVHSQSSDLTLLAPHDLLPRLNEMIRQPEVASAMV